MPNATLRANARTTPKAAPHPDAAIFALVDRYIAVAKALEETGAVSDEAEGRAKCVANPPVIIRTERDRQLELFVGNRVGTPYGQEDVRALRALVRACSWTANAEEAEAYDRAYKVLDALRDLKEKEARERTESGLIEATRRCHAALDAHSALAEQLLETQARTLDGVLAKARALRRNFSEDMDEDLQNKLRIMGEENETVAISLARDIFGLASQKAH